MDDIILLSSIKQKSKKKMTYTLYSDIYTNFYNTIDMYPYTLYTSTLYAKRNKMYTEKSKYKQKLFNKLMYFILFLKYANTSS